MYAAGSQTHLYQYGVNRGPPIVSLYCFLCLFMHLLFDLYTFYIQGHFQTITANRWSIVPFWHSLSHRFTLLTCTSVHYKHTTLLFSTINPFFHTDNQPPTVESCPDEDIDITSMNKIKSVSWPEPQFADNSKEALVITKVNFFAGVRSSPSANSVVSSSTGHTGNPAVQMTCTRYFKATFLIKEGNLFPPPWCSKT